jgi:hypothetical protein
MNPWPFVSAAYLVTLGGGAILALLIYVALRKAER